MKNGSFVIAADDAGREGTLVSHVGGKGSNLIRLRDSGFSVPPFFCISAAAFRTHLRDNEQIGQEIERVISDTGSNANSATIRELIAAVELCPNFKTQVREAWKSLVPDGQFVAVRSSAIDEDGMESSFAGMHDSFLFVRDEEDLFRRIRQVWASAFNERAIAYRRENGLSLDGIAVAIVVQQMIDASSSGVIFTCNPANNRTDEVVVSSVFGIGEGLVSGALAADSFCVNKVSRKIEAEIAPKTAAMVFDDKQQAGLKTVELDASQTDAPSLSDPQIEAAVAQAIAIESMYRRPQDIEFCFDKSEKFFVLQSRPVTRVAEYGPAAGNRLVWDNSNIIESYSGVTTPMTFSFIRRAYTIVYHCFADVMGIRQKKVQASRHVFENMLGLIRGRVYYNLQNWYRLIRLFPGFQYNARYMESMMGLREPLILDDPIATPTFWKKWFVELPALLRLIARTSWNFFRIRPIVNQFQSTFQNHYNRWDKLDFSTLAPHELRNLYHQMEDALLWNWKAPIINDFYVMIYYGLLKKLCEKWAGDETGALQNDLICGEGGVESAEPAKMLLRLAAMAADIPELCEQIFSEPIESVPQRIKCDSRFEKFNEQMQVYLDLYGFRCMNELKLEEFSLRDRPHFVYQVLRNYLSLSDKSALDVGAMHDREQRVRLEAEKRAFSSIRGFSLLPRRFIFRRVLRNARQGVKNRENMRFARTRIYGVVRVLIRAIGQNLADVSILDSREDVFYLTVDELHDFIKGTAVTANLRQLAKLRRDEFDEYRKDESGDDCVPDDRFETFGFVYHKNLFKSQQRETVTLQDGQLKGTGCCPGKLTNTVRVLRSPQDNLQLSGEILVAERTDPGWVPLYPAVSGILIERGSILSHSAVVAREMGIPTIVGIQGLLKHVHDGARVTMDGASGVIEVHDDNDSTKSS